MLNLSGRWMSACSNFCGKEIYSLFYGKDSLEFSVRSILILLIYVFQLNFCKDIGDKRKHENSFKISTAYTKTHVIH